MSENKTRSCTQSTPFCLASLSISTLVRIKRRRSRLQLSATAAAADVSRDGLSVSTSFPLFSPSCFGWDGGKTKRKRALEASTRGAVRRSQELQLALRTVSQPEWKNRTGDLYLMGCNVRKHTGSGRSKERLNHGALLSIKRSNELFSLKTLLQDFPAIILHLKAAAEKNK